MEIYLVRHGTPYSAEEDPEKSLNGKGIKECQITGKALKRLNVNIDLIISSPKKRAIQTAEIIAEALGFPKDHMKATPTLEPNGSPKDVISYLKDYSDRDAALLAGHLPSLANIASELLFHGSYLSMGFEAASACRIDIDELAVNPGALRWFLTQKHLELIANE